MSYDHNKKAGNQGDVVKHVAEVAALDTILKGWPSKEFRYADIFAGYALNPLDKGNEWKHGIGKLAVRVELTKNVHVKLWSELCLPSNKSELASWPYPGSSKIAYDLCEKRGKAARLSLWDTSESVIDDLREAFGGSSHNVNPKQAGPDEDAVQNADFVLIDPPGVGEKKGYPSWKFIRRFLRRKEGQSILLWLPVNADTTKSPPGEDEQSQKVREDAVRELGFHATKVRWASGGRTIGCQLIYQLPEQAEEALRKAIEHVVDVAGWQNQLEVPAVAHYPEQLEKPSSDTSTCRLGGLPCS